MACAKWHACRQACIYQTPCRASLRISRRFSCTHVYSLTWHTPTDCRSVTQRLVRVRCITHNYIERYFTVQSNHAARPGVASLGGREGLWQQEVVLHHGQAGFWGQGAVDKSGREAAWDC